MLGVSERGATKSIQKDPPEGPRCAPGAHSCQKLFQKGGLDQLATNPPPMSENRGPRESIYMIY